MVVANHIHNDEGNRVANEEMVSFMAMTDR